MSSSELGERVRNSFRLLISVLCLLAESALAQGPAWWYSRGAVDDNLQANDYALITCGQLKWMATNAFCEMESYFGAGSNVTALVGSFSNSNNYYLANIGQVKYVAQPFYDRLYELNLTNTFPANMPGYYPWGNSSQTNDYALAIIGQVKYVFSFDSAVDSDQDGMPDWWEATYGFNPYENDGTLDADGDGLTNLQEYQYGTNPNNSDTDGDGLSDGWEAGHGYDPLNGNDAAPLRREEARNIIISHWNMINTTPIVFTNQPGSQADLNDMKNALNSLSGKFYKQE